ncbi:unnamed protein product [Clonostachys solani]|uniref:C2H2-type domain-containing protein n=1 Tax=Clonostachys solani TaxID=160281 RepID=A0A9N9YZU3_9HYPO|nr:unnamed protein product [Clonostachys solani]
MALIFLFTLFPIDQFAFLPGLSKADVYFNQHSPFPPTQTQHRSHLNLSRCSCKLRTLASTFISPQHIPLLAVLCIPIDPIAMSESAGAPNGWLSQVPAPSAPSYPYASIPYDDEQRQILLPQRRRGPHSSIAYLCVYCPEKFTNQNHRLIHIQAQHPDAQYKEKDDFHRRICSSCDPNAQPYQIVDTQFTKEEWKKMVWVLEDKTLVKIIATEIGRACTTVLRNRRTLSQGAVVLEDGCHYCQSSRLKTQQSFTTAVSESRPMDDKYVGDMTQTQQRLITELQTESWARPSTGHLKQALQRLVHVNTVGQDPSNSLRNLELAQEDFKTALVGGSTRPRPPAPTGTPPRIHEGSMTTSTDARTDTSIRQPLDPVRPGGILVADAQGLITVVYLKHGTDTTNFRISRDHFLYKSYLDDHFLAFRCQQCQMRFSLNLELKYHLLCHHRLMLVGSDVLHELICRKCNPDSNLLIQERDAKDLPTEWIQLIFDKIRTRREVAIGCGHSCNTISRLESNIKDRERRDKDMRLYRVSKKKPNTCMTCRHRRIKR